MAETQKPLYALTVSEHADLIRQIIADELKKFIAQPSLPQRAEEDLIQISDVERMTGYSRSTIYTKVSRFEMPVVSRKKPLMFSRSEILQWMKDGKPSVAAKQADEYIFRKRIA